MLPSSGPAASDEMAGRLDGRKGMEGYRAIICLRNLLGESIFEALGTPVATPQL